MDWNAKAGSQEIPGVTGKFGLGVQNEAGQRLTVLPRERTGRSTHPLPTMQENTIQYNICVYTWASSDGQTKIRLIIYFTTKDVEALYSLQKQD